MAKDFADFLESLNREGVAYVVIGGIAVLAHIPYRTTRDLDVLIEPTLENARRHAARSRPGDRSTPSTRRQNSSPVTSFRLVVFSESKSTAAFPA